MKATLEFSLPEEREEFRVASRAGEMALVVADLDMKLRGWLKHGHGFKTIEDALQEVRNELCDAVVVANGE